MTAYNNEDPEADYNGDGQVNYFDVNAFTAAYGPLDGTDLEHWHFSYDFRNQLVEIGHGVGDDPLVATTNTYDALARRVLESTSGQTKQLVYGGVSHWEVLEQIDLSQSSEQVLTTHVYGIGIDDEVSYRIEDLQTPEDIWTHRDDLNSLTSITNESGVVKERYEYGDYGQVSMYDANGDLLPTGTQFYATHLYTGRLQIGGTGLYDYRFRVLEPETGRFVQRDPLGYVDALNPYAYVRDQPYQQTDPWGLMLGGDPDGGIGWHPSMGMDLDTFLNGHQRRGNSVILSRRNSNSAGATGMDVIGELAKLAETMDTLNRTRKLKEAVVACASSGGTPLPVIRNSGSIGAAGTIYIACFMDPCAALAAIDDLMQKSKKGHDRHEDRRTADPAEGRLERLLEHFHNTAMTTGSSGNPDHDDWKNYNVGKKIRPDVLKDCQSTCTPNIANIQRF